MDFLDEKIFEEKVNAMIEALLEVFTVAHIPVIMAAVLQK